MDSIPRRGARLDWHESPARGSHWPSPFFPHRELHPYPHQRPVFWTPRRARFLLCRYICSSTSECLRPGSNSRNDNHPRARGSRFETPIRFSFDLRFRDRYMWLEIYTLTENYCHCHFFFWSKSCIWNVYYYYYYYYYIISIISIYFSFLSLFHIFNYLHDIIRITKNFLQCIYISDF